MDSALSTACLDSEDFGVDHGTTAPLHGAAISTPLTLSTLPDGVQARVVAVNLGGCLGDRLVELGFTAGAPLHILRRAPFGGPLQLQIREFILSLRREQAAFISVQVRPTQAARDA